VLVYVAPSGLIGIEYVDSYTGLHPVLMYVALSGLRANDYVGVNTGLYPELMQLHLPATETSSRFATL